jgi:hypothetical protein
MRTLHACVLSVALALGCADGCSGDDSNKATVQGGTGGNGGGANLDASAGASGTATPTQPKTDGSSVMTPDVIGVADVASKPEASTTDTGALQPEVSSVPLVPAIDGAWWQITGVPDLGPLNQAGQQPVDFAIWASADGHWHIWSCIRGTKCGGMTRLFYHWEGAQLTDTNWTPVGIAMQADTTVGETMCGLQAPYVFQAEGAYQMFYGDWEHICRAQSPDGRTFTRVLNAGGKSSLFDEGGGNNTRDPMVIKIGNTYRAYYTAFPGGVGSVYERESTDLVTWSASKIVSRGGAAGSGALSSECPFVVPRPDLGVYYLFRTQRYTPPPAQTTVYRSPDPLDFGVDDDKYRIGTLPVAAPEIFQFQNQWYIAAVRPNLDGLQIAKLKWTPQ